MLLKYPCVIGMAIAIAVGMLVFSSAVMAGNIVGPVQFTDDATSEISTAKIYTHLLDFASEPGAVVNDVEFDNVFVGGAPTEIIDSELGFTATQADTDGLLFLVGNITNCGLPENSGMLEVMKDFMFAGGTNDFYTMTIDTGTSSTPLVAGEDYILRLYYRPWTLNDPGRDNIITFDEGNGGVSTTISEDGSVAASYFVSYEYTYSGSPISIKFDGQPSNWHMYGLSNESLSPVVPGDANKDGVVNDDDAATLASNWLMMEDATWTMGDFNNDGKVNDIDAAMLATNWSGSTTASVPEPSIFLLLSMGLFGLLIGSSRRYCLS